MSDTPSSTPAARPSNKTILWPYWITALILLPLVGQLILAFLPTLFFYTFSSIFSETTILVLLFCSYVCIIAAGGFLMGKTRSNPGNYYWDCFPYAALLIYTLIIWNAALLIYHEDTTAGIFDLAMTLPFIQFIGVIFIAAFSGSDYLVPMASIATYAPFLIGFVIGAKYGKNPLRLTSKQFFASLLTFLLLLLIAIGLWQTSNPWLIKQNSDVEKAAKVNEDVDLKLYKPFTDSPLLTPLQSAATLIIRSDYPKIDGATAAYPLYASAVQAVYLPSTEQDKALIQESVQVSKTPVAYQRLIDGQTDMLIVAQPSKAQIQRANDMGVTLKLTPIAREAFVFIASKTNPVTDLSVEQIREIYSGGIANWKEIGGPDKPILAFQRPENSGSQSTMQAKVMQHRPMKKPLKTERGGSMGGVFYRVADYRNAENSLGYSFRYYASAMNKHNDIRLLSINGIAPSIENIRNGSYPFTVDVYIVTNGEPQGQVKALTEWFLSEQGQRLIADVGYVPLNAK